MTEPFVPTFIMRRGDRLPLLAVQIEDDDGQVVNLTSGRAYLMFRPIDGEPVFIDTGEERLTGWYRVEAYIPDPTLGIVSYDWMQVEVDHMSTGVFEIAVEVIFTDGTRLTAPTDRRAQLIVRPGVAMPAP